MRTNVVSDCVDYFYKGFNDNSNCDLRVKRRMDLTDALSLTPVYLRNKATGLWIKDKLSQTNRNFRFRACFGL